MVELFFKLISNMHVKRGFDATIILEALIPSQPQYSAVSLKILIFWISPQLL
jgi:hypothetical protein